MIEDSHVEMLGCDRPHQDFVSGWCHSVFPSKSICLQQRYYDAYNSTIIVIWMLLDAYLMYKV